MQSPQHQLDTTAHRHQQLHHHHQYHHHNHHQQQQPRHQHHRPHLPAAAAAHQQQEEATMMDQTPADVQSMDWLLENKERIYLLAQFWQQRATLAEKEASTLKEELSGARPIKRPMDSPMSEDLHADKPAENSGDKHHQSDLSGGAEAERDAERPMDVQEEAEECEAKNKEISVLVAEVQRLRSALLDLQASHQSQTHQIQQLEGRLDAERVHLDRLEARRQQQQQPLPLALATPPASNGDQTIADLSQTNGSSRRSTQRSRSSSCHSINQSIITEDVVQVKFEDDADQVADIDAEPPQRQHSRSPSPPQQQHHQPQLNHHLHHHNAEAKPLPLSMSGGPPPPHFAGLPFSASSPPSSAGVHPLMPGLPPHFHAHQFAGQLLGAGGMGPRLGDSLIPKGDPMEARLQEMLRHNLDKYANHNLDTMHISRRVRELLSVHNIGQRIFAKYVLGLSQGTVSELLSKPKPWDKLTEKGRDSYRKMHAWSCDEGAVMLVKSLVPKKDSVMPTFGRSDDTSDATAPLHLHATPAAHLLASQQPHPPPQLHSGSSMPPLFAGKHLDFDQHDDHNTGDMSRSPTAGRSPSPAFSQESRPHSMHSSSHHPMHFGDHHNSSAAAVTDHSSGPTAAAALGGADHGGADKMSHLYQEEMAKLSASFLLPHLFRGAPMAAAAATPEETHLRLTLEAYQREMLKLQQGGGPGQAMHGFPAFLPGLLALQHQQQQQQQQQQQYQQQSNNTADPIAPYTSAVQDLSVKKESTLLANGNSSAASRSPSLDLVRPKSEPTTTPTVPTAASATAQPIHLHTTANNATVTNGVPTQHNALGDDLSSSHLAHHHHHHNNATNNPLQRMASITNSLLTQPPASSHYNTPQRPPKATLPPITQQQFDAYNTLNTDDIVRRVKESLSQNSISQRLFGESVLGLSQGSVSDLLARPKPWHMLTQKGREPFIRMQMYLEDDGVVHRLVATQYKIAPEKLMRTGTYGGSGVNVGIQLQQQQHQQQQQQQQQHQQQMHQQHGKDTSMSPTMHSNSNNIKKEIAMEMHAAQMSRELQQQQQQQQQHRHNNAMLLTPSGRPLPANNVRQPAKASPPVTPLSDVRSSPALSPPMPALHMPTLQQLQQQLPSLQHMQQQQQQLQQQQQQLQQQQQQQQQLQMPTMQQMQMMQQQQQQQHQQQQQQQQQSRQTSPSVYEMAAMSQDLDTYVITTRVKEVLLANNIGQKIFGETVLGLSQGSVSELLSKPKPWHMLSIKGREPFMRMQLWLVDITGNVDRLQLLKTERREATKRRRSTGSSSNGGQPNNNNSLPMMPSMAGGPDAANTSCSDTSSSHDGHNEFYTSHSPAPANSAAKKQRVLFSDAQKEALRLAFKLDSYPNVSTIEFLATELGLSTRTVSNWFHNHRMRLKQQLPHGPSDATASAAASALSPGRDAAAGSGTPFDPIQFRLLLNQRLVEQHSERMGGLPMPYQALFASNPGLAAALLAGGSALLNGGANPAAAAAAAGGGMMMGGLGLDLSVGSSVVKRERDEGFDETTHLAAEDSSDDAAMSEAGVNEEEATTQSRRVDDEHDGDDDDDDEDEERHRTAAAEEDNEDDRRSSSSRTPPADLSRGGGGGGSRRKPAAPQWVKPAWMQQQQQNEENSAVVAAGAVQVNGVCVMQQATDYSANSSGSSPVAMAASGGTAMHNAADS